MNVLDMSPRDFRGYLREIQSMGTSPEQISRLQRAYRDANSSFSGVLSAARSDERALAQEGRAPIMGGLLSIPQEDARQGLIPQIGGLLSGGARNVEYEGIMPMARSMAAGAARAADAPSAAAAGVMPRGDMIGEAMGTAGLAMGGGTAFSRPSGSVGMGGRVNKQDLDPLGYQKTKMRDYLSNTQVDKRDLGERLDRKPISWEQMENKVILPFYGDRTSGGYLLSGVDDIKFDKPVYTEGGVDFMRGRANQADNAIWASNSNITTRIAKEADKAREKFETDDVFGVTGSMAPDANDFAVHTGSSMAELVKGAKITRQGAAEFNEIMRSIDPTFVGIRSPKLREWIDNTTSPNRKSFIRLMDSSPMQEKGFPSPAQARLSVTDPSQIDTPAGQFGLGVSKIDELNPLLRANPEGNRMQSVPHSTYNTQVTGQYVGSLPPVPQGLLFRDVYDSMEGKTTKKGQPLNEAHKTHAIKTKMPAQRVTPQVLEGILGYLSSLER